jgi:hypothetical protein
MPHARQGQIQGTPHASVAMGLHGENGGLFAFLLFPAPSMFTRTRWGHGPWAVAKVCLAVSTGSSSRSAIQRTHPPWPPQESPYQMGGLGHLPKMSN